MADEQTFVVDETALQEAKERWNRYLSRSNNKVTASFDEMFNFFDTIVSFSEIAEKIGVTREYVRQLYSRYFSEIFGDNLAKNKQKERNQENAKLSHEETEKELFSKKPFKSIIKSAKLGGCDVHIASTNDCRRAKLKQLIVNNCLCSLKTMKSSFKPARGIRSFVHASIRKPKNDEIVFVIFYYKVEGLPERIFVVPFQVIEDVFFKPRNKISADLYLPTKKEKDHNQLIDWWKYENAWHLIA